MTDDAGHLKTFTFFTLMVPFEKAWFTAENARQFRDKSLRNLSSGATFDLTNNRT